MNMPGWSVDHKYLSARTPESDDREAGKVSLWLYSPARYEILLTRKHMLDNRLLTIHGEETRKFVTKEINELAATITQIKAEQAKKIPTNG